MRFRSEHHECPSCQQYLKRQIVIKDQSLSFLIMIFDHLKIYFLLILEITNCLNSWVDTIEPKWWEKANNNSIIVIKWISRSIIDPLKDLIRFESVHMVIGMPLDPKHDSARHLIPRVHSADTLVDAIFVLLSDKPIMFNIIYGLLVKDPLDSVGELVFQGGHPKEVVDEAQNGYMKHKIPSHLVPQKYMSIVTMGFSDPFAFSVPSVYVRADNGFDDEMVDGLSEFSGG